MYRSIIFGGYNTKSIAYDAGGQKTKEPSQRKPKKKEKRETKKPKEDKSLEDELDLLDDEIDEVLGEAVKDVSASHYKLSTDGQ